MSDVIDEHRKFLADRVRLQAYRAAIRHAVQPGAVVLDLGAGTGILGMLACCAGARRVYAVEATGMIELARHLCRANGFAARVVFVKGLSTEVELPERVDGVVADQIGRYGFDYGLAEVFRDARERFLRPGGWMIPESVALEVAPVDCPEVSARLAFWHSEVAGFNLCPAYAVAANHPHACRIASRELLAEPVKIGSLDLRVPNRGPLRLAGTAVIRRAGCLHGLGAWFRACLAGPIEMTNSPLSDEAIERRQAFFPIETPTSVSSGDRVNITLIVMPRAPLVSWRIEVRPADGAAPAVRFEHSTLQGLMLCREDLRSASPRTVPQLSPRGQARLSVLHSCDGRRTNAEIAALICRRHQALFPSIEHAERFVVDVVRQEA